MANFEVPENPEFTEDIRKLETTDPGHANIFNAVFEPIINNVLHVKKMITDHMMAKNPHGIKPADLGLENVENKPMGELSTEFTVAGTRSNIQSGQAMKTILGMLSRWYTDLKTVAWSGKYNDLTDKPTIPNGAAASCAVANNDTTTAAGSVADARIVRQHGLEIDEINRDLGGFTPVIDDTGRITGYKTRAGADTVFPFSGEPSMLVTTFGAGDRSILSSFYDPNGIYSRIAFDKNAQISMGNLKILCVCCLGENGNILSYDYLYGNPGGTIPAKPTKDILNSLPNNGIHTISRVNGTTSIGLFINAGYDQGAVKIIFLQ